MKPLHLILKRKWFEMIASGEKTEEYRELSNYWTHRLCFTRVQDGCDDPIKPRFDTCKHCRIIASEDYMAFPYDAVTFQLGYSKKALRMTFEVKEIDIGEGREEWGAEPGKQYFIIKLGKRL